MSHNNAIAGRGKVTIVDNPTFPPTDFFEPGKTFPCRLRHATIGYMDDAIKEVRSAPSNSPTATSRAHSISR